MEPIKYINRLKECRLSAQLKQHEVIKLLNLKSPNRLSRWENGLAEPGLKNLIALARIYKVKVEELFPIDDGKPPQIVHLEVCKCQIKPGEGYHVFREVFPENY